MNIKPSPLGIGVSLDIGTNTTPTDTSATWQQLDRRAIITDAGLVGFNRIWAGRLLGTAQASIYDGVFVRGGVFRQEGSVLYSEHFQEDDIGPHTWVEIGPERRIFKVIEWADDQKLGVLVEGDTSDDFEYTEGSIFHVTEPDLVDFQTSQPNPGLTTPHENVVEDNNEGVLLLKNTGVFALNGVGAATFLEIILSPLTEGATTSAHPVFCRCPCRVDVAAGEYVIVKATLIREVDFRPFTGKSLGAESTVLHNAAILPTPTTVNWGVTATGFGQVPQAGEETHMSPWFEPSTPGVFNLELTYQDANNDTHIFSKNLTNTTQPGTRALEFEVTADDLNVNQVLKVPKGDGEYYLVLVTDFNLQVYVSTSKHRIASYPCQWYYKPKVVANPIPGMLYLLDGSGVRFINLNTYTNEIVTLPGYGSMDQARCLGLAHVPDVDDVYFVMDTDNVLRKYSGTTNTTTIVPEYSGLKVSNVEYVAGKLIVHTGSQFEDAEGMVRIHSLHPALGSVIGEVASKYPMAVTYQGEENRILVRTSGSESPATTAYLELSRDHESLTLIEILDADISAVGGDLIRGDSGVLEYTTHSLSRLHEFVEMDAPPVNKLCLSGLEGPLYGVSDTGIFEITPPLTQAGRGMHTVLNLEDPRDVGSIHVRFIPENGTPKDMFLILPEPGTPPEDLKIWYLFMKLEWHRIN